MKPSNSAFEDKIIAAMAYSPSRPSKTPTVRCPRCVQRLKCDYCASCSSCSKEIQQCTRCMIRNGCSNCSECKECEVKVKCIICAKRKECERCNACETCNKPEDEKEYVLNISKEPEGSGSGSFGSLLPSSSSGISKKNKKKLFAICRSCFSCCKFNEVNDIDIEEVRRNADSFPNHPLWTPTLWFILIGILFFFSIFWFTCGSYIRAKVFVDHHTFFKYDQMGHVSKITNTNPDSLPGNPDQEESIYTQKRPWPQYIDYTRSWTSVIFPIFCLGILSIFVILVSLIGKGIDVQDRRFQRMMVITSIILILMITCVLFCIYGFASYMDGFEQARARELYLTQTSTFVLDEIYEQITLNRLINIDIVYMIDAERIKLTEVLHGKGLSHESILDMAINNTFQNKSPLLSSSGVGNGNIQQNHSGMFQRFESIGGNIVESIIAMTPVGGALMMADNIKNIMDSFSGMPNIFDNNPQVNTIDINMIMKQIDWIRSEEYLVTRYSMENNEGYIWIIILTFIMFILSIIFAYYLSDIFYGYIRIKHGFTWDHTL